MGAGAPSRLTPAVRADIKKALEAGTYLEGAAAYAGIARSSLYGWLRRGRRAIQNNDRSKKEKRFVDFVREVDQTLGGVEIALLGTIDKASEKNWCAAAWLLERRWPKRWALHKATEAPTEEDQGSDDGDDYDTWRKSVDAES